MSELLLDVRDLSHAYHAGTRSLYDVSLRIEPGERVAIIGPNGSGKSTLLMCINGLLQAQGEVRFEGRPVSPSNLKDLRGRLGLVFQNPDDQLFMPTLADDLAFGPINLGWATEEVNRCVREAAERFGLATMLDRAPHHMSMGQKHLAAIACVLVMQPTLLMMDEPTSSLDARARRQVLDVLNGWDRSLLIASHDLPLVEACCRRAIVIDDGRIVADAPVGEILSNKSLLSEHGLSA